MNTITINNRELQYKVITYKMIHKTEWTTQFYEGTHEVINRFIFWKNSYITKPKPIFYINDNIERTSLSRERCKYIIIEALGRYDERCDREKEINTDKLI